MKFFVAICLALFVAHIECENKKLKEIFSWKLIDYKWKTPADRQKAIDNKDYIPENNLILGLERWKNKLFVTVPRWKSGVMSTLNYINISEEDEETPKPEPETTEAPAPTTETTEPTTEPPTTTEPPPPPETTTEPPPPPETTTEPPDTTTEPPDTTTEPPDTTTEPPDTTTEPPDTTTEPPDTTTEPPDTTTEPPDTTTEPPPPPETTTEPPPPPPDTPTEAPPPPPPPPDFPTEAPPPPPDTITEPPPDDEEDGEDEPEEEDEEEPEEEEEEEPEEPTTTTTTITPFEGRARNKIAAMRRLISNFEFIEPETKTHVGKLKRKKDKEKGKEKDKNKEKRPCKGKPGKRPCNCKPKPCVCKPRPCVCKPKPPKPDPTTPAPVAEPRSPPLIPYPSFEANYVDPNRKEGDPEPITSVFRVRVDACDRLWVMDSGSAGLLDDYKEVVKPRILIYDLKTDKLIREYKLKESDKSEHSFFANIIVDVTPETCDKAFAYLPDLSGYAIIVYDYANDKSWKISHNYFHFDPLAGNMNVGGVNFQWTDGVFSIALTKPREDGYRTAYFHALCSTKEFKVDTKVLQDVDGAKDNYHEYKLVGDKGPDSQTSASFIHEDTGVLFYTQLQKDSINCWNTNKKLIPENLEEVASHNETMIFTNDIKVDYESNLWVLTDKLPLFMNNKLDYNEVNYRIFTATVKDAIAGTKCEA